MPLTDHDARRIRCPRLGHAVGFCYCRAQEGRTICPRVLDCWRGTFDVRAFLEAHLPAEQFRSLLAHRPKPKVVTLVELIQRAREGGECDE